MNCRYSPKEIALYVEQDLPVARAREVELHLVACNSCRELADEVRESQAIFKSLKQDTVSAAALSSVRNRVLAEVQNTPTQLGWGRWIYALAGGLVVVIVSVVWIARVEHRVDGTAQLEPALRARDGLKPAPTLDPQVPARVQHQLSGQSVGAGFSRSRARSASPAESETPLETLDLPPEPTNTSESSNQVMVKLLTDDPNVVIYWLVDQKNGGTL